VRERERKKKGRMARMREDKDRLHKLQKEEAHRWA
jgi:hypothetical protein